MVSNNATHIPFADLFQILRQSLILQTGASSPSPNPRPMARPVAFTGEADGCSGTSIQQQMAIYDDVTGLENFIQRSVRISQRLADCGMDFAAVTPPPTSPSLSPPAHEPMQVDAMHLSVSELQRRIDNRLCLYCGSKNHLIPECPVRPPRSTVSPILLPVPIAILTCTTVTVTAKSHSIIAHALFDSGLAGNFISHQCLDKLRIKKRLFHPRLKVQTVLGEPLGRVQITHCTPHLTLKIGCLHRDFLPDINWSNGEIRR